MQAGIPKGRTRGIGLHVLVGHVRPWHRTHACRSRVVAQTGLMVDRPEVTGQVHNSACHGSPAGETKYQKRDYCSATAIQRPPEFPPAKREEGREPRTKLNPLLAHPSPLPRQSVSARAIPALPARPPHPLILPCHFPSPPVPATYPVRSLLYIAIKGSSFPLKLFLCGPIQLSMAPFLILFRLTYASPLPYPFALSDRVFSTCRWSS
ncbi:hypothetical protein EDB85DRAFT_1394998 [Lactarius pseudohatsudake]|nr:hypothetical protein EDB85DRAFT_1394998 [Lactarius pseudohatsudake]